jgi:hypothetical protein
VAGKALWHSPQTGRSPRSLSIKNIGEPPERLVFRGRTVGNPDSEKFEVPDRSIALSSSSRTLSPLPRDLVKRAPVVVEAATSSQ